MFSTNHPKPAFDAQKKNAGDVLLKVNAAAMNPVDYKLPKAIGGAVRGIDVCGTVTEVGASVSDVKIGDVVIAAAKIPAHGAMAEFTVAGADKLVLLPSDWTVEEGAAIPVAYNTAITGFEKAGMIETYKTDSEKSPVDSILVIGASGGCGTAALQLAKGMKISRIIGICSSKNDQFCKDHGATEIVAYDDAAAMESFLKDNAGKIDVIYDAASSSGGGEDYFGNSQVVGLLKQGKKSVSSSTTTTPYVILNAGLSQWARTFALGKPTSDPRIGLVMGEHSKEKFSLVLELLGKAKLKPAIDCTLEFTEQGVQEGYDKLHSRRAKGKIVVKMATLDTEK